MVAGAQLTFSPRNPPNYSAIHAAALRGCELASKVLERHAEQDELQARLIAATGRVREPIVRGEWDERPRVYSRERRRVFRLEGPGWSGEGFDLPPGCEPAPLEELERLTGPLPASAYRYREFVDGVIWEDGTRQVIDAARGLRPDWLADPATLHAQLSRCSTAWGAQRETGTGTYHAQPYRCGSQSCPFCVAYKARRTQRRKLPMLLELVRQGCELVHLTLTQPPPPEYGAGLIGPPENPGNVVLHGPERRWYDGQPAPAGGTGWAVEGAALGDELERLRSAWRSIHTDSSSARWWRESVMGCVTGVEWTTRRGGDERRADASRWHGRYHAHLHVLVAVSPGVDVGTWGFRGQAARLNPYRAGWGRELLEEWIRRVPGAELEAQAMIRVTGDEEETERAVREVLKYPFKPGTLTDAQIVEVLASTKGGRFHHVGGAFHGSSHVAQVCRWLLEQPAYGAGLIGPPELVDLEPQAEQIEGWIACAVPTSKRYHPQPRRHRAAQLRELERAARERTTLLEQVRTFLPAFRVEHLEREREPERLTVYRRPVRELDMGRRADPVGPSPAWVRVTWRDTQKAVALGIDAFDCLLTRTAPDAFEGPSGLELEELHGAPVGHTRLEVSPRHLLAELATWRSRQVGEVGGPLELQARPPPVVSRAEEERARSEIERLFFS